MFEGKPPFLPGQAGAQASTAESDSLRELSWSDLTARLAAARDLRVALAHAVVDEAASFDPPAARHVAALANGKEGVNPSDLANGKGPGAITASSPHGADDRPLRN